MATDEPSASPFFQNDTAGDVTPLDSTLEPTALRLQMQHVGVPGTATHSILFPKDTTGRYLMFVSTALELTQWARTGSTIMRLNLEVVTGSSDIMLNNIRTYRMYNSGTSTVEIENQGAFVAMTAGLHDVYAGRNAVQNTALSDQLVVIVGFVNTSATTDITLQIKSSQTFVPRYANSWAYAGEVSLAGNARIRGWAGDPRAIFFDGFKLFGESGDFLHAVQPEYGISWSDTTDRATRDQTNVIDGDQGSALLGSIT